VELTSQLALAAFVIGGLAVTLYFLRRHGLVQISKGHILRSSRRRLLVEERVLLTPQTGLCLVRWNQKSLLVAFSQSGCQVLESAVRVEE
jgi:hypothetical protein